MKVIAVVFITLITLLYIAFSYSYLVSEIYEFPESGSFRGEYIYNPYAESKSNWFKANFQAHTKSNYGITYGKQSADEVLKIYRDLDYDLIYISDYHNINRSLDMNNSEFIPIYEHGYSLEKAHRLVFGSQNVSFFDIPYYFGISGKQYIINRLKQNAGLIALAHPAFMNGHSPDDLRYISNYDLLEVANHFRSSAEHWDSALSAGNPVWLIASDDSHDLESDEEVGRCWTMVNSDGKSAAEILDALRKGRTYGVQGRRGASKNHLVNLSVEGLKVKVEMENYAEIGIIGQNGRIKRPVFYARTAEYEFSDEDTYIRFEFVDRATRSKIYLNPVIRYDGKSIPNAAFTGKVDYFQTYAMRFSIILSYLLIAVILYGFFKSSREVKPKTLDLSDSGLLGESVADNIIVGEAARQMNSTPNNNI